MTVKPVPDGFHTATPSVIVRNAAKAIDFYKKVFGAEELMRMPNPDGLIIACRNQNRRFDHLFIGRDSRHGRQVAGIGRRVHGRHLSLRS